MIEKPVFWLNTIRVSISPISWTGAYLDIGYFEDEPYRWIEVWFYGLCVIFRWRRKTTKYRWEWDLII